MALGYQVQDLESRSLWSNVWSAESLLKGVILPGTVAPECLQMPTAQQEQDGPGGRTVVVIEATMMDQHQCQTPLLSTAYPCYPSTMAALLPSCLLFEGAV